MRVYYLSCSELPTRLHNKLHRDVFRRPRVSPLCVTVSQENFHLPANQCTILETLASEGTLLFSTLHAQVSSRQKEIPTYQSVTIAPPIDPTLEQ
jgi:hypothetical protein